MADNNFVKFVKPTASPSSEASAEKAFDAAVSAAMPKMPTKAARFVSKGVNPPKVAKTTLLTSTVAKPALGKPIVPVAKAIAAPVAAMMAAPAKPIQAQAKLASVMADQLGTAAKAAMADAISVADRMADAAKDAVTTAPTISVPVAYEPTSAPAKAAANTLKGLFTMATTPQMFGDMSERAKGAFEKSSKMSEEMVEFGKGNVEALVSSARVAAKGSEAFAQEAAEFGKKSFESATAAFKSMAAVKSPTELFQLQSDFAKSSFDSAVAEASKVSESMLKLMGEMFQPLSNRYAVASEKMKDTAAL